MAVLFHSRLPFRGRFLSADPHWHRQTARSTNFAASHCRGGKLLARLLAARLYGDGRGCLHIPRNFDHFRVHSLFAHRLWLSGRHAHPEYQHHVPRLFLPLRPSSLPTLHRHYVCSTLALGIIHGERRCAFGIQIFDGRNVGRPHHKHRAELHVELAPHQESLLHNHARLRIRQRLR